MDGDLRHLTLTRRRLLLGATALVATALATACGVSATQTPLPATVTLTAIPAATATPVAPTPLPATATAPAAPPPTAMASPAATSTPAPPAILRLPYGPEPPQFGDLRLPAGPGPHPLAIVIHGGFWMTIRDVENTAPACVALAAQGIATWNIEYRRLGNPGGGWPGTLLDVAAAADHLRVLARDHPLDLARVVVVGHSSGGHLALWLGGRRRIPAAGPLAQPDPLPARAVIALAGISNLAQAWDLRLGGGAVSNLIGGTPQDYPDRYAVTSPAALLPLGTRQVIVHGEIDQTVPFQMSVDYQAAARASSDDVTLLPLPRTGHAELLRTDSEAWQQAEAAIAEALAR